MAEWVLVGIGVFIAAYVHYVWRDLAELKKSIQGNAEFQESVLAELRKIVVAASWIRESSNRTANVFDPEGRPGADVEKRLDEMKKALERREQSAQ
jgi:hypothetical protein